MKLLIDADGCPVVDSAVRLAGEFGVDCMILCDTSHRYEKPGAVTVTVSKGADSVDFALVNLLNPGDLVVTQDYGLAAMCLARKAAAVSQDGMEYTAENIDALLYARDAARKIRSGGGRLKGSAKREKQQDTRFEETLSCLLARGLGNEKAFQKGEHMSNSIEDWGFSQHFIQSAGQDSSLMPARVIEQHRGIYRVVYEKGMTDAKVTGKLLFDAAGAPDFPAVGDWVMIETDNDAAAIHRILPRKSVFIRRAAGTAHEKQVVAANIDTVFVCMAMNADFNLRRLERYLAIAWEGGALPVVVLTKPDLNPNPEILQAQASSVAAGCDVVIGSGLGNGLIQAIVPYLQKGKTVAFIGSSGVGKSTLINRLAGEDLLATREIRQDGKGRHTTTHRQLVALPNGALVIDTPGMRELGAAEADLQRGFSDIDTWAQSCRFKDCTHTAEPGCAVLQAVERGELDEKRLENYKKLQTEIGYEGLNFREVEKQKIDRMFGGKGEMKKAMREVKNKNARKAGF